MIITNTVLNNTTTFMTVASSSFDELVAGTLAHTTARVILTSSAGTSYTQDFVLGDVSVNASGDDSVLLQPSLVVTGATTFTEDFYTVKLYTSSDAGVTYTTLLDEGCTLVGHTLACDIATKLLSDSTTTFHLTYAALDNAGACLTCDCASLTLCYTALVTDVASTDATTNCGCS